MHRLVLVVSLFVFCAHLTNAADPISDKTGRYMCDLYNATGENLFPVLTIDLNTVAIKLSAGAETNSSFDLQNSTIFHQSEGICDRKAFNETFQSFTLKLDEDNYLELEFIGNETNYHLEKVSYHSNDTKSHFQVTKPDLRLSGYEFKPKEQGYKCANLELNLEPTNKDSKDSAQVQLGDFMFFAFQDGVATSDVTRFECRQAPKSSIIPIVVGAALLAFAAVIGVLYYFKREKPTPAAAKDKA